MDGGVGVNEAAYETLIVERSGAVMTVRLNRPHKRNAINRQMHQDLQALCRAGRGL